MMKTKTRIPALILCFVLLLSVIPTLAASAANTLVSDVGVTGFRLPVVGQTAGDNLGKIKVPAGAPYSLAKAKWADFKENRFLADDEKFQTGRDYYLVLTLKPAYGCAFTNVTPTLNGSQECVDTSYCIVKSDGTYLLYSIELKPITQPASISAAGIIGFKVPAVGQTVAANLKDLTVPADANYSLYSVRWRDDTAKEYLSDTDRFEKDHVYYLAVALISDGGLSFEGAHLMINGSQEYVDVEYCKKGGEDSYWLYSINLTPFQPAVINTVELLGFRKPTPGQTAGANLASLSVPSNAKYSISDAYWVEVSSYSALSDTDVFEEGVTYFLSVYVEAKYGYTFTTGGTNPTFDGSQQYVDTAYCMVTSVDSYRVFSNDLVCTAPAKVPTVNVTGFKEPVAGQTVASNIASLKVPAGANYVITEAYWLDVVANKIVSGSDVFEAGRFYYLTVCLDPKDGYTLSGASAQLNGSKKDVDADFCGIRGGEYEVVSIEYLVQPSTAKKGDINDDGVLNAFDYQMVKAYVLGTFPSATAQMITAMDVNGDGNINAFDYQMIKAAVLGTYSFS